MQISDMKQSDLRPTATQRSHRRTMDTCWSVPIAAAFSGFLLVMASSCYGYLYVLFMKKYGISHEQAAWPSCAMVIAASCTGLFVSQIQYKVPVYHIILAGSFAAASGLVASAFASNIVWMTITFGILYGAGIGTALLGLSLYILLYFDKYSGTAFAMMWICRAASGMAGTPLLWHLTAYYGVQGSLLITGGLMMHVLPFVMLIKSPRPFSFSFPRHRKNAVKSSHSTVKFPVVAPQHSSNLRKTSLSVHFETKEAVNAFADALASFKKIPFYALVFYSIVSDYVFVTFTATVVAYAADKGCSLDSGKQLPIYNSVGLLAGRVVVPFITDKILHSRCPLTVASFVAAAAYFLAFPHVSSYGALAALSSAMGVAQGYILCIKSVVISDYMGVTGLSFCAGVGGLLSIPLWLSSPSIIGFFRDTKGSYDNLYATLAALSLVTAAQLTFIEWWEKRRRRRLQQELLYNTDTSELEPMKLPRLV